MAIDPKTQLANIDNTDPVGYPLGKAKNVSSPGSGDGTAFLALWVNDLWGYQQALLDSAGIVPSGTPDKVGASQYLEALIAVIGANSGGSGANENPQAGDYNLLTSDYGAANDKNVVYTGSGGDTFTHLTSASLTAGDYVFIEHRGTGILEIDFANASDRRGAVSLGRTNLFLSPGEKVRYSLTDTTNVWSVE